MTPEELLDVCRDRRIAYHFPLTNLYLLAKFFRSFLKRKEGAQDSILAATFEVKLIFAAGAKHGKPVFFVFWVMCGSVLAFLFWTTGDSVDVCSASACGKSKLMKLLVRRGADKWKRSTRLATWLPKKPG